MYIPKEIVKTACFLLLNKTRPAGIKMNYKYMKYFEAMYLRDVLSSTGKSQFVKSVTALQLSDFSHWQASFSLTLPLICLQGQKDTMRNPDLRSMVNLTTHLSENLWTKIIVLFHSITWKIKPVSERWCQIAPVSLLQEEEIPEGGIAYSRVLSVLFLPAPVSFRRDCCHVDKPMTDG